jgi:hypothetical protein
MPPRPEGLKLSPGEGAVSSKPRAQRGSAQRRDAPGLLFMTRLGVELMYAFVQNERGCLKMRRCSAVDSSLGTAGTAGGAVVVYGMAVCCGQPTMQIVGALRRPALPRSYSKNQHFSACLLAIPGSNIIRARINKNGSVVVVLLARGPLGGGHLYLCISLDDVTAPGWAHSSRPGVPVDAFSTRSYPSKYSLRAGLVLWG